EAEVLAVNDVDFTPAHDGCLVNRFEVVFPIVRLKGDVDSLGQVLQRPLYPDLSRIDLEPHVTEAPGLPCRDRAALTGLRRKCYAHLHLAFSAVRVALGHRIQSRPTRTRR